jgi:hypothetical protein
MKTFTTLALAAALATSFAGASFAQTMSDSDKAMMTKCKGMSESAMKADQGCMAMMKSHPDMMKAKDGMASPAAGNANPTPKSK